MASDFFSKLGVSFFGTGSGLSADFSSGDDTDSDLTADFSFVGDAAFTTSGFSFFFKVKVPTAVSLGVHPDM